MGLPAPSPNKIEYERILNEGFNLFPKRKENYDNYFKCLNNGYSEVVDYMPIKMDYEVSSICNFRCTMCLMSDDYISKNRPAQMTFEKYRDSLNEQYGLVEVKLQGIGEPLLNPDFFNMVRETVNRRIWTRTVTNGSLLHLNDNYRRLIDEKIGEIQISIDGAKKKTFEGIRKGSNFEQVVENVKMLNKYAESKNEAWRTSCWMLVQKENVHEMEDVLNLAEYMHFTRVVYSMTISSWGTEKFEQKNKEKNITDSYSLDEDIMKRCLNIIEEGKKRGIEVAFWSGADKYNIREKRFCDWLFQRAYITGEMKTVPCCTICDANVCDMGNAEKFSSIWNDSSYMTLRRAHLSGNIPKMCKYCYE